MSQEVNVLAAGASEKWLLALDLVELLDGAGCVLLLEKTTLLKSLKK